MSPKGLKRAASAGLPEPRAKQAFDPFKEYDVSRPAFEAAVLALEHPLLADLGINEDCQRMLSVAAPLSLCAPKEQRHAHQQLAVEMLGEVVAAVEGKLAEVAAAEESRLEQVEASRAGLERGAEAAEAELAAASEDVDTRKGALDRASAAVLAARRALSERQEEQRRASASAEAARAELETLEAALRGPLARLKGGEWTGAPEAQSLYAELARLMGKLQLDDSLVTALPVSTTKKPEERGAFDKMVVEQLDVSLRERVRDLTAAADSVASEGEQRAAAVVEAEGSLSQATEAQERAAGELNLAQGRRRKAAAAVEEARSALERYGPERQAAADAKDAKSVELRSFREGCLASFQSLRDRSAPESQRELKGAASVAGGA